MNQSTYVPNTNKAPEVDNRVKSGAGWLFAIGILSMVNTALYAAGAEINFIVGLGITQIIEGFMLGFAEASGMDIGMSFMIITFLINMLIASSFILLGFFARKGESWAFIVSMVLYGLDALLFALFADWIGVGFHIFALYFIYGGFKALKESSYAKTNMMMEQQNSLDNNPIQ